MNNDVLKHTATNGTKGTPASGSLFDLQLEGGASGSYAFTEPGTYQVTCTLHPTMNMTITVQ
jgi:Copper binding proteins, plastocyanin/azurin family.